MSQNTPILNVNVIKHTKEDIVHYVLPNTDLAEANENESIAHRGTESKYTYECLLEVLRMSCSQSKMILNSDVLISVQSQSDGSMVFIEPLSRDELFKIYSDLL